MPQKKNCCYHRPYSQADQKKPPVGGERDQKNCHYGDGHDQTSRLAEGGSRLACLKIRLHVAPRRRPILERRQRTLQNHPFVYLRILMWLNLFEGINHQGYEKKKAMERPYGV